jgi:dolichyl-phosphate-mannose--protein O-mannosyl transferase
MKPEGKNRKWAYWLLLVGVGLQFYFVQEVVAAFAFFVIGLAAVAFFILSLYMLQKGWAAAVEHFTDSEDLSGSGLRPGRPAREVS